MAEKWYPGKFIEKITKERGVLGQSTGQLSDVFRGIGNLIHYIDVKEKLFASGEVSKLRMAIEGAHLDTREVKRQLADLEHYIEYEGWHMATVTLSTLCTLLGKAAEVH
jgi:hypothetical protein